MDFITQLPLLNSFDSILVIVNRFSKMAVFIPTMSSMTSLDLAHLFIKNIFSNNGLPSIIVSDRGSLFGPIFVSSSRFQEICQLLTIQKLMDRQRGSDHSSTKQSPFFTFYGRYPPFYSVHITQDTPAGKLSKKIQSVQQYVKRELEVAINRFKRSADKSRASPPVFNPGDMKVSTHSYHLKLTSQWKTIHPVFHISLLEPVKTSTIPNRHQEPPPPIIIEEEEEWEVSQILESNLKRENCGIWWNGKVSVKTQKDPLGNQLKISKIALNLLRIFILSILTIQDPILQELDFYGSWWGEELPKLSLTPGMHL
ncbi:hypothetical protein O181_093181 [Austropuccinia psidii MF-1]|uniref:Integrase catalytic domain-containing protein n=1 Tax=Austropuccinia psidii MF-1 TaxID=1389203 RepID=A0A9Q3J0S3_9BASI|nr:hypothetical protein [Austropuccinia psidii MF-1]